MGGSGGLIGGITDAIGLTDYSGAAKAQEAAADAAKAGVALSAEQVEFMKEQYNDWKAIFGDLTETLGDYFKSLEPDDVIAPKIQSINKELAKAKENIEVTLAQKGLDKSSIAEKALTSLEVAGAQQRAQVRATAQDEVAAKQMGFLGLGLGQGTQMLGQINMAGQTAVNASGNLANVWGNMAITKQKSSMDIIGDILGGAAAAGTYAMLK